MASVDAQQQHIDPAPEAEIKQQVHSPAEPRGGDQPMQEVNPENGGPVRELKTGNGQAPPEPEAHENGQQTACVNDGPQPEKCEGRVGPEPSLLENQNPLVSEDKEQERVEVLGNAEDQQTVNEGDDLFGARATAGEPESALSRARELANEAAEAHESAEQASKVARAKQVEATIAANQVLNDMCEQTEGVKREAEETCERATKLPKLAPQEDVKDLSKDTLEKSAQQVDGQDVLNCPQQVAPMCTELPRNSAQDSDMNQNGTLETGDEVSEASQHLIDSSSDKSAAGVASTAIENQDNSGQQMNQGLDSEPAAGPSTPTQTSPPVDKGEVAPSFDKGQPPPAPVLGGQGAIPDPVSGQEQVAAATIVQNGAPFPNPSPNISHDFQNPTPLIASHPDPASYRTNPENQAKDQGPTPMQVG